MPGNGAFDEAAVDRRLGGEIDDAAGGAASEQHRRGSLVDLDGIHREVVARVPARVAHAIAEHVVVGCEAADVGRVALISAFAGAEGDAGDVAQRVLHG